MKQYNPGAPFKRITINGDDPFPTNKFGNKCGLVVNYHFNEGPEVNTTPNQDAEPVSDVFIIKRVTRFGVPIESRSETG